MCNQWVKAAIKTTWDPCEWHTSENCTEAFLFQQFALLQLEWFESPMQV